MAERPSFSEPSSSDVRAKPAASLGSWASLVNRVQSPRPAPSARSIDPPQPASQALADGTSARFHVFADAHRASPIVSPNINPIVDPFAPVSRRQPAASGSFRDAASPDSAFRDAAALQEPRSFSGSRSPHGSSSSNGSSKAPAKAPGTPSRGVRRPHLSATGRARLAGALVLLIVLGAAVVGIQQLTSSSPAPGKRIDSGEASAIGAVETKVVPDAVASVAPPTPVPLIDPRTGADSKVKLGIFVGTNEAKVRTFGKWLGREPDYVIDFSSRSTWAEIANPAYMINHWQGSDYRMVYSVALLPAKGSSSIKAGARGEYDEHFRALARLLVAGGQEDAILRLGWEFNLKGWKWSSDNPKDFISYWRHIVTAMRSVPGEKLRFDWNPNIGETPYEAHLYYPGGKYVDYVGVDVYDVSWQKDTYPYPGDCDARCRLFRQEAVWERLYDGHYGLRYWADFARSKGKPMSVPEWGLWRRTDGRGGGDNPYFIKQMHAFIDDPANRVAYHGYLQVDVEDGEHKLNTLKAAGRTYRKLFK